ncbi:MAG: segregation/condensation protein A [Proteobacteria bacterium]|nr:segregation/condensation protein A [Pseudomonadota bacterium]
MSPETPPFEENGERPRPAGEASVLVLSLDGFDGPIDLLLALAREQKVDLVRISILQLADQYLAFIAGARSLRIEIAADYLVMAAWLAYLKSRLLLPKEEGDEEPSGEELAAVLAFQLQRLEAMREAGARLFDRPLLGLGVFARGEPEDFGIEVHSVFQVTLYDLLKAYADHHRRANARTMSIEPSELFSIEEAMQRMSRLLGVLPEWSTLTSFLPPEVARAAAPLLKRSALATTFSASLELAKAGALALRQAEQFGPIYVRKAQREP